MSFRKSPEEMQLNITQDLKCMKACAERLSKCQSLIALTGAGISAESGIATFRDAQSGIWKKFSIEDLATPQGFEKNPKRVWDFYDDRRSTIAKAEPNLGHIALNQLLHHFSSCLITQNIDGLHQLAGTNDLIELHGNIHRIRCSKCEKKPTHWDEKASPPKCHCGAFLRPDVVWFGEMPKGIDDAMAASMHCDAFLSIGTSAMVFPAAELPIIAKENGAILIEINPEKTSQTSRADWSFQLPAGALLPQLAVLIQDCHD